MNKMTSLNVKSYYNFLQSTLSIDQIINYAIVNKQTYASLIDKNLHGSIEFYNKCKQNNLKPIIGLEFEMNQQTHYAIAKNYFGYQKLCKLSSLSCSNKQITIDLLNDDNIFLIYDHNLFEIETTNQFKTTELCFIPIITNCKNNAQIITVLDCIKNDKKISLFDLNKVSDIKHSLDIEYQWTELQIETTQKIINQINWILPENPNNFIDYQIENTKYDKATYFYKLVEQMLRKKMNNFHNCDKQIYLKRLQNEYELIKNKNFIDYFLVVSDFINYAKKKNIMVGPGRGSAAGSLISYALNITEIDPIKYNLLFERFLNEARMSLPDIDIDIMDTKRDIVVEYLNKKYGNEKVAQIITFAKYKSKLAIRDVGRVLGISISLIDKITKKIPIEYEDNLELALANSPGLSELYLEHKQLFDIAKQLIGCPRQHSIHAAGIILSNQNLSNVVATMSVNNESEQKITQVSMEYLEQLGLIKIDLLSLKNLTIIDGILKLIKGLKGVQIDLYKIDVEDQNVFKLLSEAKTLGIFQFESSGMRSMLKRLKPVRLEDLSIVSAIYRPGPLQFANQLFENKNQPNKIKYIDDSLKEILAPTYGIIIYQEQIINIVQKVANFSPKDADLFRKAISKKEEDKIIELRASFIKKALQNHYSEEVANKIFSLMLDFASYGFNHSHSISYALISYFLAFLKFYYPLETYTILLSNISDKEKLNEYKNETKSLNIFLKTPNINLSSTSFVLQENKIYFSFNAVNGLGEENAKRIINIRNQQPNQKFASPELALFLLSKAKISKRILEALISVGCFDEYKINRNYLLKTLEYFITSKHIMLDNIEYEIEKTRKEQNNFQYDDNNYAELEKRFLGVAISESHYSKTLKQFKDFNSNIDQINPRQQTLIFIKEFELKVSKKNEEYLIINANILDNDVEIFVYDDLKKYDFENNQYYLVNLKNLEKNKKKFVLNTIIRKI